ncbi:hypothetical protein TNCV_919491 [Trichonephila clavipes]|nr:hypothetical protein TNCV_919491 [Trichonephila clavipes]
MLGRRIAARPRPPATVRDLEIALLEEWNSIPQSLIDNLIASMANRGPPKIEQSGKGSMRQKSLGTSALTDRFLSATDLASRNRCTKRVTFDAFNAASPGYFC